HSEDPHPSPPWRAPHCPQRLGSLEASQERVKQMLRTKPDRVVHWEPGLVRNRRNRAPRLGLARESRRVERDARDRCPPRRERDALVQLDELTQSRNRMAGTALDLHRARGVT